MNSKELGNAIFGPNYCNQEVYIIEAFFASPYKYSDETRNEIYNHIQVCERCTNVFHEAQLQNDHYERMMRD